MSLYPLTGGIVAGDPSLGFYNDIDQTGLLTSLELVLDAGAATSYTSGQKWLDISGNGYDFFLGSEGASASTGDEPTFTGSAGGLSDGEYFLVDGGDFFSYDTGTLESWMTDMYKDNADWTVLMWTYGPAGGDSDGWFGVGFDAGGGGTPAVNYQNLGAGTTKQQLTIWRDSEPSALAVSGATSMALNAWHMHGISFDEATGAGGAFFFLDGAYNQVSSSDTWNATISSAATNDGAEFHILDSNLVGQKWPNLTRIAGFMAWSTALSFANIDALFDKQKGRFGI
jgi:hypothetical protein